jgi:PleD family two-component response regulator
VARGAASRCCETQRIALRRIEEKVYGNATLSATLNTPISELRLAPMERILVIEDDGGLRKILWRLFSSEGYEVDVASDAVCGLERLRQGVPAEVVLDLPRPGSSGLRTIGMRGT